MNSTGKNIAYYRKLKGITQKKLAEIVGISTSFMSQIENGISNPSWDNIVKLANALEVEPNQLATIDNSSIDTTTELIEVLRKLTENDIARWHKEEKTTTIYTSYIEKTKYKIEHDIPKIALFIEQYGNFIEVANSTKYHKELNTLLQAIKISIVDKNYIYSNLKQLKKLLKED